MLSRVLSLIDALSAMLLGISCLLLVALLAVNANEVVARYALSQPTVWAYDLASLLNGALFLFALAFTLRVGGHVQIDVFATRLPGRLQRGLSAGFHLLFFVPCLAVVISVSLEETRRVFLTNERLLSAWEPPLWPGYLSISVGLTALLLQSLAVGLRALSQGSAGDQGPGTGSPKGAVHG